MALFDDLLRLFPPTYRPTEDYFTEVFAALIRHHPPLLWSWLNLEREGWPIWREEERVEVLTQVPFPRLNGHATSSIVDFVFRRFRGAEVDTLFLESKLGAPEGVEQLPRYTQHLHEQSHGNKLLVYCTRDFDPKPMVGLLQVRWHTFYHILAGALPERVQVLAGEVRAFMRDHNLAMNNRLTPTNLLAMSEAVPTFSLLWEVLYSQRKVVDGLVGSTTDSSSVFNDLREYQRLNIRSKKRAKVNAIIGFDLNPEYEVPLAVVMLEGWGLEAQDMERFREAVHRRPEGWEIHRKGDWVAVARMQPVTQIIYGNEGQVDHVNALRAFFEEELEKARAFKQEHRHTLPWAR